MEVICFIAMFWFCAVLIARCLHRAKAFFAYPTALPSEYAGCAQKAGR